MIRKDLLKLNITFSPFSFFFQLQVMQTNFFS